MSQFEVFRLQKGQDLKKELSSYENDSFVVISSVGSLTKLNFRMAGGDKYLVEEGNFEIVSLNGTICKGGLHLHISVSREDGSMIGGHLMEGCLVDTTCEVVLARLNGWSLNREHDENTGYLELVAKKNS